MLPLLMDRVVRALRLTTGARIVDPPKYLPTATHCRLNVNDVEYDVTIKRVGVNVLPNGITRLPRPMYLHTAPRVTPDGDC